MISHLHTILNLYDFNDIQQKELLDALELVNCKIENFPTIEETLIELNNSLQICFPRAEGMERQQISDKFTDSDLRAQLLPLLSSYIDEITTGNDTASKLLLGANEISFRERIETLVKIEKHNHSIETYSTRLENLIRTQAEVHIAHTTVCEHKENTHNSERDSSRTKSIVYPLGGERRLWAVSEPITAKLVSERLPTYENVEEKFSKIFTLVEEMEKNREAYSDEEVNIAVRNARLEAITYFTDSGITWPTETDMMNEVIKEYRDKFTNVVFKPVINADRKFNANGESVRPNTIDTYKKFWEIYGDNIIKQAAENPNGKIRIAIISNQPFARAQEQQAIDYFRDKPVIIDVIAKGANLENINISKLFRSFAETIHAGMDIASETRKDIQNKL